MVVLVAVTGVATPALAADSALAGSTGYDISWPQCGGPYPADPAFGIVGVNKGIVFSPNPCLASEISWAGGTRAGLYANTANPGPALSTHWPVGQKSPRICDPANTDTGDCAYDYGYNAAADSFTNAVNAFAALGLAESPSASAWWLDVETSNSWRSDVPLNIEALSGAVGYLASAGVADIGFYSTQYQWNVITGGTAQFAAHQSWVPGAADSQDAAARCGMIGFTGGSVALAQYITGGFDADISCAAAPILTSIAVLPASGSVPAGSRQQFTARADDQFGQPISPQPTFSWSATGGSISQSGLFTAGPTAGGPFTVSASAGGVSGTASVTVTSAADFSISASPASQTVKRGRTASYTVSVLQSNGFGGSVAFTAAGQPSGSIVSFSPNPGATTSTLSVKTSSSTPRGSYTLTITGTSGSLAHTAVVTLNTK